MFDDTTIADRLRMEDGVTIAPKLVWLPVLGHKLYSKIDL